MNYKILFEKELLDNKNEFEFLLKNIQQSETFEEKLSKTKKAINFAIKSSTGYYCSEVIENVLLDFANRIETSNLSSKYEENSVLHVMTESCKNGGHTRVAERWIEFSNNTQSLLFTENQEQKVPDRLAKAVNDKNGKIIFLEDNLSEIEKAIKLREIASNFDKVVLHIHMHDIIPMLAFGTEKFKRPVFLFNHADHRFWLGVSISDVIINFREWGANLSFNNRGCKRNFVLPIPAELKEMKKFDINKFKKELKLPLDKKIVFTAGSFHKYKELGDLNFTKLVKKILNKYDNIYCLAIGPTYSAFPKWKKLAEETKRTKLIGQVSHDEFIKYLCLSDVVLDSFPMSGGTALIDAVCCEKPVLSLSCPTEQSDFIMKSCAYCNDEEELLIKLDKLLVDDAYKEKNINEVYSKMKKDNDKVNWVEKLQELYESIDTHSVNLVKQPEFVNFSILDSYLFLETYKTKIKFKIPYIFKLLRVKKNDKKYMKICLFDKFEFNI